MNSQRKQMLQESIDYLKHDARMPSMANAFSELLHDYEKLHASIIELQNDAARYRIASEQDNFCDFVIHAFGCYCDDKESADRVIDTAMQKD